VEGRILADEVLKYWSNFVNTGKPTSDLETWPAFVESVTVSICSTNY